MTLYEIATDYKNFIEAVENGEIPEEAITDTLESIQSLLEDKADNIAVAQKMGMKTILFSRQMIVNQVIERVRS